MPTLFLIRHGAIDPIGHRLVGRTQGIHLNDKGRNQAKHLAAGFPAVPVAALYASPLERAQETAEQISLQLKLPIETDTELTDIDYGDWTGKSFAELDALPAWAEFNRCRCNAQIPGGESMAGLSERVERVLDRLSRIHQEQTIVLVSHADWIRMAVARSLEIPLDRILRFEISPGSLSIVRRENWGSTLLRWNDHGELN